MQINFASPTNGQSIIHPSPHSQTYLVLLISDLKSLDDTAQDVNVPSKNHVHPLSPQRCFGNAACVSSHDHAPLNQIVCRQEVSTRTYFSLMVFVELFLLSNILGAWKSKSVFNVSPALAFWSKCHLCLKGT